MLLGLLTMKLLDVRDYAIQFFFLAVNSRFCVLDLSDCGLTVAELHFKVGELLLEAYFYFVPFANAAPFYWHQVLPCLLKVFGSDKTTTLPSFDGCYHGAYK
jgi:hypothetical protein